MAARSIVLRQLLSIFSPYSVLRNGHGNLKRASASYRLPPNIDKLAYKASCAEALPVSARPTSKLLALSFRHTALHSVLTFKWLSSMMTPVKMEEVVAPGSAMAFSGFLDATLHLHRNLTPLGKK